MNKFYENPNFSVGWSVFWTIVCIIVGIYFWETYRIVSFISFFIVFIYIFYILKNHYWKKEKKE
jgi:purine-cytosine permease-like protein